MALDDDRRLRMMRAARWLARGWSVASIGLLLAFVVGEGGGLGRLTSAQALGFVFFPVGVCVGMVVAWRREGLGGAVTVGSLLAFYAVHLATSGRLPRGAAWLAFAAPGFLFLLTSHVSQKIRSGS